jgi:hypothetical protein
MPRERLEALYALRCAGRGDYATRVVILNGMGAKKCNPRQRQTLHRTPHPGGQGPILTRRPQTQLPPHLLSRRPPPRRRHRRLPARQLPGDLRRRAHRLRPAGLLRAEHLHSGIFTICLNQTVTEDDGLFTAISPILVNGDFHICRAQKRNSLLAEGLERPGCPSAYEERLLRPGNSATPRLDSSPGASALIVTDPFDQWRSLRRSPAFPPGRWTAGT